MFSPRGICEHGRLFSSIEEKSNSIADCQAKRTANNYLVLTIGPHAHELKNCMTVLLLRSACSEGGVDQATDSRAHGQTLEEIVAEMDRLVDEFVRLVESG